MPLDIFCERQSTTPSAGWDESLLETNHFQTYRLVYRLLLLLRNLNATDDPRSQPLRECD